MLVFSTSKYISTYADVFQISVGEAGYLLLDKKTYDELLEAQLTVDIEDEKTRLGIENNKSAISFFETYVPQPVSRLAILFDRLSFEPPLDLEVLFGVLSTLTMTHGVMHWFRLTPEDFKLYRFSDYILQEHEVPRKLFLTSCIPYDEMMNPEKAKENIHHFLYLAPVNASPANLPFAGIETGVQNSSSLCMDDDDQQYYIDRKSEYEYMGSGMFADKQGNLVEIEIFDDVYLSQVFGISLEVETVSSFDEDGLDEDTEDMSHGTRSITSAPPDELAPDNSETTKNVHDLFHKQRERFTV